MTLVVTISRGLSNIGQAICCTEKAPNRVVTQALATLPSVPTATTKTLTSRASTLLSSSTSSPLISNEEIIPSSNTNLNRKEVSILKFDNGAALPIKGTFYLLQAFFQKQQALQKIGASLSSTTSQANNVCEVKYPQSATNELSSEKRLPSMGDFFINTIAKVEFQDFGPAWQEFGLFLMKDFESAANSFLKLLVRTKNWDKTSVAQERALSTLLKGASSMSTILLDVEGSPAELQELLFNNLEPSDFLRYVRYLFEKGLDISMIAVVEYLTARQDVTFEDFTIKHPFHGSYVNIKYLLASGLSNYWKEVMLKNMSAEHGSEDWRLLQIARSETADILLDVEGIPAELQEWLFNKVKPHDFLIFVNRLFERERKDISMMVVIKYLIAQQEHIAFEDTGFELKHRIHASYEDVAFLLKSYDLSEDWKLALYNNMHVSRARK